MFFFINDYKYCETWISGNVEINVALHFQIDNALYKKLRSYNYTISGITMWGKLLLVQYQISGHCIVCGDT